MQDFEGRLHQLSNERDALQDQSHQQQQRLEHILRELDEILAVLDQELALAT